MKLLDSILSAAVLLSLSTGIASAAETNGYPPYVTDKKLYASRDLRGKSAPKLEVEQWLAGTAPNTTGKVVLIDFWATWCPPCAELVPELNKFKKKFGDDLVIIGISDEPQETVRKFMKAIPIDYNVALAPSQKMKDFVGVKGIPHVLVISPDGIVRWQGFPPLSEDPLTEEKIAQIIKASKAK